jgi:hypothetical protein
MEITAPRAEDTGSPFDVFDVGDIGDIVEVDVEVGQGVMVEYPVGVGETDIVGVGVEVPRMISIWFGYIKLFVSPFNSRSSVKDIPKASLILPNISPV